MRLRTAVIVILTLSLTGLAEGGATEESLWEAARQGDLDKVRMLVENHTVDVNAQTKYGATALAYACDRGHVEMVRYLLEHGADVNTTDTFYQFTPLAWAGFKDNVAIVELLIDNGATGTDAVLIAAVRSNSLPLARAALKGVDLSPGAVVQALSLARAAEGAGEMVALLEAVEVETPEHAEITVAPEVLATYTGQYRNDEIALGLEVRVEEGTLVAQATGQGPLELRALSETRFEAVDFPQIKIGFGGRGGTIEQAVIEQSDQTFVFPRVAETASTADDEVAATPKAAPAPIARQAAQNWPSFRGPGASGIADGQGATATWDVASGRNVLWKTPIPGLANSSPIVWGQRVFVTTAISAAADDTFRPGLYGDVDSVEDLSEHTFKVYALDRESGKILWERTAATRVPGAKRHLKSTQANSTPVSDGKRVVALFGTVGMLVAYDLEGKRLWKTDVGVLDAGWFYDQSYQWGHASSPAIYKDLVIVQADTYKDSFIAAYALKDGKQVWKTPRNEVPSWGSPTVYRGKTRDEVVTNGSTIRGYDPATGKELWSLGPNSEVTVATPVIAHDMFYVTAGYPPVRPIYAIRPGGNGDLSLPGESTASESVAWSHDRGGTYMPIPIVYGGRLYTCANDGRLTVYDSATGEQVYRARVGSGGTFTASPIAADGKLYFTTEEGDVVVVRAGDTYEEIAKNAMGEICMSTPAISDGVLVVRTQKHVFGLGDKPDAPAGGTE